MCLTGNITLQTVGVVGVFIGGRQMTPVMPHVASPATAIDVTTGTALDIDISTGCEATLVR